MGKKKQETKPKSGSPLTTLIVALISSIVFFLIGVEVGKEYAIREGIAPIREEVKAPLPVESVPPPKGPGEKGKQEEVDINFYDQLMKEGDQELNMNPEAEQKQAPNRKKAKSASKPKEGKQKKEKPGPSKKSVAESNGAYALQVAAFRERDRAVRMANMLREKGFTPHILKVSIPGKPGHYYRIWVGYYPNITEAAKARRLLLRNHALRISRATIVKR
ncbi:MAG: hypothetical protein DSY91_00810 [Deltaproteobacteria bacterium]|nr:MAG: hypothetical protein DSY91_00810 [Deltaproteobacteria bacterium]